LSGQQPHFLGSNLENRARKRGEGVDNAKLLLCLPMIVRRCARQAFVIGWASGDNVGEENVAAPWE